MQTCMPAYYSKNGIPGWNSVFELFKEPRLRRRGGFLRFLGVFLIKAFDAPGRIDQLLLARKEGMALRADFDFEIAGRGTCFERGTANTGNNCSFVGWMDSFFHNDLQCWVPQCGTGYNALYI